VLRAGFGTTIAGRKTDTHLALSRIRNEEPPYFYRMRWGALFTAGRCKRAATNFSAMISLENDRLFFPMRQTRKGTRRRDWASFIQKVGNFIGILQQYQSRSAAPIVSPLSENTQRFHPKAPALPAFYSGGELVRPMVILAERLSRHQVTDTAPFRYRITIRPATRRQARLRSFTLVVSGMEKAIEDLDKL